MVILNNIKSKLNWLPDIAFYTIWIYVIVNSYITSLSILLYSRIPKYILDVTIENNWFILNLNWVMKELVLIGGCIAAVYKVIQIFRKEYRSFKDKKKPPKSDGHSED